MQSAPGRVQAQWSFLRIDIRSDFGVTSDSGPPGNRAREGACAPTRRPRVHAYEHTRCARQLPIGPTVTPLPHPHLNPRRSGKLALVVTPTLGAFLLSSELTLLAAQKDPSRFGVSDPGSASSQDPTGRRGGSEYVSIYFCCLLPNPTQCTSLPTAAVHGQSEVGDGSGSSEGPGATRSDRNVVRGGLKLHHHAANWVFDHPFHILVGASLPVVGSIYYGQSDLKHLKLSQKVMHTRVMGQLSVLSILLGVMFFREHMKLHGRYLEEGEAEEQAVFRREFAQDMAQELIRQADVNMKRTK